MTTDAPNSPLPPDEGGALVSQADADLAERVRAPDPAIAREAFARLFERYWIPLCKWGYYFVRDREAAEEIVSDVLADVWQRRETWEPRHGIEAYLFGAVRTRVREEWRTTERRTQLTRQYVDGGDSVAMSAPVPSPDAAVQADDLHIQLQNALAALPGRARAAVMYRWYEGLEYDIIAQRLGTTEGAARVIVTRALHTLRGLIPGR